MLDPENMQDITPITQADAPLAAPVADDLPQPPRPRRSASRPAGPPTPVVAEPDGQEAGPAPVGPPVTAPADEERQEVPATPPTAEELLVVPEPAAEPQQSASAAPSAVDADEASVPDLVATSVSAPSAPEMQGEDEADASSTLAEITQTLVDSESASQPPRTRRVRRPRTETAQNAPAIPAPRSSADLAIGSATGDATQARLDSIAEATVEGTDLLAASIAELTKTAPRRRPSRTSGNQSEQPFALEISAAASTADVLEVLAAAIAESDTGRQVDELDAGPDAEGDDGRDVTDTETSEQRRRRRRRGGRRRRRQGEDELAAEVSTEDTDVAEAGIPLAAQADEEDHAVLEEVELGSIAHRRRRRRRRRGEDASGAEDDPHDVVVRVREPRPTATGSEEVTDIEGSTRMEAKKQRRREGRAAVRRRAPILSEAEFLARRESVERVMAIRQNDEFTEIGVLEDGILVEHYVDRKSATSLIGNIYLGRVQNVLPSMEAAFIDIGRGRNAVLYAGEIDWERFGVTGQDRKVEKVLKSAQQILVQVTKDPVGAKGARLSSHISIPGRYVVYSPGGQLSGISRKLPEPERKRLKDILDDLLDEQSSVIVRTAAEGASEEELVHDVNRLKAQWETIDSKVRNHHAPQLLYSEPDLTVRIIRDLFTEDFDVLVVDGNGGPDDAFATVQEYVDGVAPHLRERLVHWNRAEQADLFDHYRIDEQIAKALERKVYLPSGGSLVIDRTEAMTVIDVNTGKFTGTKGNLEATVTSNNLEAAEEIVRQLRLRDIGGIIVIDFIDMVLPANRELLLRRLVECLGRDRTRHQVSEVTSLGLVQMTRKKIGTGLAEAFTVTCETCRGRGYHIHDLPVDTQAPADGGEREQRRQSSRRDKRILGPTPATRTQHAEATVTHDELAAAKMNAIAASSAKAVVAADQAATVQPVVDDASGADGTDVIAQATSRRRTSRAASGSKTVSSRNRRTAVTAIPEPEAFVEQVVTEGAQDDTAPAQDQPGARSLLDLAPPADGTMSEASEVAVAADPESVEPVLAASGTGGPSETEMPLLPPE